MLLLPTNNPSPASRIDMDHRRDYTTFITTFIKVLENDVVVVFFVATARGTQIIASVHPAEKRTSPAAIHEVSLASQV